MNDLTDLILPNIDRSSLNVSDIGNRLGDLEEHNINKRFMRISRRLDDISNRLKGVESDLDTDDIKNNIDLYSESFQEILDQLGKIPDHDENLAEVWKHLLIKLLNNSDISNTYFSTLKQLTAEDARLLLEFKFAKKIGNDSKSRFIIRKLYRLGLLQINAKGIGSHFLGVVFVTITITSLGNFIPFTGGVLFLISAVILVSFYTRFYSGNLFSKFIYQIFNLSWLGRDLTDGFNDS